MSRFVLILSLVSVSAFADITFIPATSSLCGPYRDNDGKLLTILSENAMLGDIRTADVLADVRFVLRELNAGFFRAGDLRGSNMTMCLGFYDDSPGINSFAKGAGHLILGANMFNLVYHKLDSLVRTLLDANKLDRGRLDKVTLNPRVAASVIVMHEFSHNLQNLHRLTFPGPTARAQELHADCTAAFLMGTLQPKEVLGDRDVQGTAKLWSLVLGDHHFEKKGHHGTPEEREAAIRFGLKQAAAAVIDGQERLTSNDALAYCAMRYPATRILLAPLAR